MATVYTCDGKHYKGEIIEIGPTRVVLEYPEIDVAAATRMSVFPLINVLRVDMTNEDAKDPYA